jgi:hypothetical protein
MRETQQMGISQQPVRRRSGLSVTHGIKGFSSDPHHRGDIHWEESLVTIYRSTIFID